MSILRAIASTLTLHAAAHPPCRLRAGFMGTSCSSCGGNDFGGRFACGRLPPAAAFIAEAQDARS